MTLLPTLHAQGPLYCRASEVANALGIPRRLLLEDIRARRTPVHVRVAYFGAGRIAHLMADDARALIHTLTQPQGGQR